MKLTFPWAYIFDTEGLCFDRFPTGEQGYKDVKKTQIILSQDRNNF